MGEDKGGGVNPSHGHPHPLLPPSRGKGIPFGILKGGGVTSLLLGLGTAALGIYGISHWFSGSSILIKLLLPVSFICGGFIAVLAGLASLKK